MEPWRADTWQVHRTTDPFRLKVLFSPTPEQTAQLPEGAEFQGKTITAAKSINAKGEALAAGVLRREQGGHVCVAGGGVGAVTG